MFVLKAEQIFVKGPYRNTYIDFFQNIKEQEIELHITNSFFAEISSKDVLFKTLLTKKIKSLNLYWYKTTLDQGFFDLVSLPLLETLDLSFNYMDKDNCFKFKNSITKIKALKSLKLHNTGSNAIFYKNMIPELLHLESLTLLFIQPDEGINSLKNLKHLELRRCNFLKFFQLKMDLKKVKKIFLFECENLDIKGLFDSLKGNNNIFTLYFNKNTYKKEDENYIQAILSQYQINNLYFSVDLESIQFKDILSLKELNIFNTKYPVFEKIIESAPYIDVLTISYINFENNFKNIIQFLLKHQYLKVLTISDCNLKDISLLGDFLKLNSTLTELHLFEDFECGFETFFNGLSQNESLKRLSLNHWHNKPIFNLPKYLNMVEHLSLHLIENEETKGFIDLMMENKSVKILDINSSLVITGYLKELLCKDTNLQEIKLQLFNDGNNYEQLLDGLMENRTLKRLIYTEYSSDINYEEALKRLSIYNFSLTDLDFSNTYESSLLKDFKKRNLECSKIYKFDKKSRNCYFSFQ